MDYKENIMFGLFNAKNDKKSDSFIDNVNINKDGVVSLNIENKEVQVQIFKQIEKLKTFEKELSSS